ncbi:MAG: hypothetical protein R3F61_06340 [Myxococcota bacterium]
MGGRDDDDDEVTGFSLGDFAAFETDDPFMTDEVARPAPAEKPAGLRGPQPATLAPGDTVIHTFKTDWVELSEAIPERSAASAERWVRVEAGLDDDGNALLRFPDGLPAPALARFLFDLDDADSVARLRSASGHTYTLFVPPSVEEPVLHGVSAEGVAIVLHLADGRAQVLPGDHEAPHHPLPRAFLVYETRSILVDGKAPNPDLRVEGLDR